MDEAADALTICRDRCGDEVADQLLPVELLVAVMDVVAEPQERIDGLDAACAAPQAGLRCRTGSAPRRRAWFAPITR